MDVPPQGSPKPTPSLSLAIGLMVLGAALGVLSVVMVTLPLLRLVRDAPSVTTPGSVTLSLHKGLYKVFEPTGTATAGPAPGVSSDGVTAISTTDVNVSGPDNRPIPVSDSRADEIITRGRRHYSSAVAFRVSTPGGYTVRIAAARGDALISRSLADAVRSRVGWVAGIPVGGLLFLIGLVLLVVRIVRRSRARTAALSGYPPPGSPGAP
ncbi:MAG TPA: hypothetical protein VN986_03205 [Actinomycetota bacterium]|nr:hypothetical protein [Actinomycetota bacterium]